jgi:excisionase family DNA binding protein
MRTQQLARRLGCSIWAVYRLVRNGRIPYDRPGRGRGTYEFDAAAVEKALEPPPPTAAELRLAELTAKALRGLSPQLLAEMFPERNPDAP